MFRFLRAHGFDPGPTQRPIMAGALTGLVALPPAAAIFVSLGSFSVTAERIMQLPAAATALILAVAFVAGGMLYGCLFRRAANDRGGGWLFGLAFGFFLWVAAPVVVLPLIPGSAMAAGKAAIGFLVSFLAWGLGLGLLFPYVHRPLQTELGADGESLLDRFGPDAAAPKHRLLRRQPSK
ncbi:MAG: hypothetical protein M3M95_07760 [Pseudomonadota bacterium]|nr:hypothetical protein [Pseudomonadota bacterium]